MMWNRRDCLHAVAAGLLMGGASRNAAAGASTDSDADLKITDLRVTPIALPDPPLLAASGCHGPYFLRNIVEIHTDAGIVGIGETRGGVSVTEALQRARERIVGQSVFAYGKLAALLDNLRSACYAGVELACLDAMGRATGRRLCDLLGGAVRERVEFAAYLFFRYAADHPTLLSDERIVDARGRGDAALDHWGEVRTPAAMSEMAWQFHRRWGFRVQKLKAGVLSPDVELETLEAINDQFGGNSPLRIDPNGRWTEDTAVRIGRRMRDLPIEYYEDPVGGQRAMARVRRATELKMGTNSCVTSFDHIGPAVRNEPIDVLLCDHHYWGGIPACQALGRTAAALGWGLSQHSNNHAGVTMAAMIHLAAVVPELTYASDTHYVWLIEGADVIEGSNLKIEDGHMSVPSSAGVGVELDRDNLAKAHEVYKKCGMRNRDDASTMRRVEPGWERTLF